MEPNTSYSFVPVRFENAFYAQCAMNAIHFKWEKSDEIQKDLSHVMNSTLYYHSGSLKAETPVVVNYLKGCCGALINQKH